MFLQNGTCRTVSHGKLERLNSEGYRHILNVDGDNWLKYSELGPGIPGKPCVFPFKVNGIEFNECTSYQSPYGWPRCATKESQDLDRPRVGYSTNMVSSWGFCSQECPVEEDSCLVVSGDGSYEMCDFPFEYNSITYNECTWDWPPFSDPKDAGAWCKWNNGTEYGRGKCGSNCPIPTKPEGDCLTINGKPCQF